MFETQKSGNKTTGEFKIVNNRSKGFATSTPPPLQKKISCHQCYFLVPALDIVQSHGANTNKLYLLVEIRT